MPDQFGTLYIKGLKSKTWRVSAKTARNNHNRPANIFLFKGNNENTRKRCEISSKLTMKTPELRHQDRLSVFIVNFGHIWQFFLTFVFLTLGCISLQPYFFYFFSLGCISVVCCRKCLQINWNFSLEKQWITPWTKFCQYHR